MKMRRRALLALPLLGVCLALGGPATATSGWDGQAWWERLMDAHRLAGDQSIPATVRVERLTDVLRGELAIPTPTPDFPGRANMLGDFHECSITHLVNALAEVSDASALRAKYEALVAEADRDTQGCIAIALGFLGLADLSVSDEDQAIRARLCDIAGSTAADRVRSLAARALGCLPRDEGTVAALKNALADPSWRSVVRFVRTDEPNQDRFYPVRLEASLSLRNLGFYLMKTGWMTWEVKE